MSKDTRKNAKFNDQKITIGSGGEVHQLPKDQIMTTQQGVMISDDQNSLKVGGPRGPGGDGRLRVPREVVPLRS